MANQISQCAKPETAEGLQRVTGLWDRVCWVTCLTRGGSCFLINT